MPLRKDEAYHFVENVLKIAKPEEKMQSSKLQFLNDMIIAYHETLPFQSVTLLSKEKMKRRVPTEDEILAEILSSKGGLCLVMNTGFKMILECLGFNVCLISGEVEQKDDHVIIVASIDGREYLVDVGTGYPTFEAIPLDFAEETSIYNSAFLQFKFVRKGDSIERWHFRKSRVMEDPDSFQLAAENWYRFYDFQLNPVELSRFDESMSEVYTNPGESPFFSLRAVRFFNGKCLALKEQVLLTEREDKKMHAKKLETIDEMRDVLLKICPAIPACDIELALKVWEDEIKPKN